MIKKCRWKFVDLKLYFFKLKKYVNFKSNISQSISRKFIHGKQASIIICILKTIMIITTTRQKGRVLLYSSVSFLIYYVLCLVSLPYFAEANLNMINPEATSKQHILLNSDTRFSFHKSWVIQFPALVLGFLLSVLTTVYFGIFLFGRRGEYSNRIINDKVS